MIENWIDEEVKKIIADKEEIARVANETNKQFEQQKNLWHSFKLQLRDDIIRFMTNVTIQDRYKRQIEYEDNEYEIDLRSVTYPALYFIVKLNKSLIEIKWQMVTPFDLENWSQNVDRNMQRVRDDVGREELQIISGPGNVPILEGRDCRMGFDKLSEFLLRKFMVDPTIFPQRLF